MQIKNLVKGKTSDKKDWNYIQEVWIFSGLNSSRLGNIVLELGVHPICLNNGWIKVDLIGLSECFWERRSESRINVSLDEKIFTKV